MSVTQETGQNDPENEVNIHSLVPRMPPLIPLPQPGHWLPMNITDKDTKDNVKIEHNKDLDGWQSLHLKCSSCLAIIHSSLVPYFHIEHPLCLPCWTVMAMALDHLPLNRRQTYMDMMRSFLKQKNDI